MGGTERTFRCFGVLLKGNKEIAGSPNWRSERSSDPSR
jgi:hypothetical protein